jgi:hypothetical protein
MVRRLRSYRWFAAGAVVFVIAVGAIALLQRPGAAPVPSPPATVQPTPTPVPGPTLGAALMLNLVAANIEFRPKLLEVPALASFIVHLRNLDPEDIIHVVDVRDATGTSVSDDQEPIAGGMQTEYVFGPLPAGDYVFICRVHPIPGMTGALRVR